jgi:hypothetical protein
VVNPNIGVGLKVVPAKTYAIDPRNLLFCVLHESAIPSGLLVLPVVAHVITIFSTVTVSCPYPINNVPVGLLAVN